jgi:hypothetical protein
MMEAACASETQVNFDQTTQYHIPQDNTLEYLHQFDTDATVNILTRNLSLLFFWVLVYHCFKFPPLLTF